MLKLKEEIVKFKSTPEMFDKEKKGIKSNTLRVVDYEDERFIKLRNTDYNKIRIYKTNSTEYFEREITDITFWFVGTLEVVIISW